MNPPIIVRKFNSILDWVNWSENEHPTTAPTNERESCYPRKNWHGVTHKSEAFDLLRAGWKEGLEKMRKVMDCCRNLVTIESPQYQFVDAVEGSAPNVEAYLHGIPEDMHFMEPVMQDAPPTYISIQLEMFISAFTSPEQCTWAGAVVFAAMEALKAQGCNTSLLFSHSCAGRGIAGAKYSAQFPVPPDLDMDTVAYLFTHPSCFRVIVFSLEEHEPEHIRRMFGFHRSGYYGYPTRVRAEGVDGLLSIQHITSQFRDGDEAHNVKTAQAMLKSLVDTKFKSYMVEGD